MKKTTYLSASLFAAVILSGCTSVREIGTVNGVTIHRATARGVFSPSTTAFIASNANKPGEIDLLTSANGPGVLPAVATAGGVVGGAALLRPARTAVDNSTRSETSSGASSSPRIGVNSVAGGSSATATGAGYGIGNGGAGGNGGNGGAGSFTPPGHIDNPSDNR